MSDKLAETTEDDNSVTMLDVLQVENQLEEDAYAVLGASDDQNCTYNKVVCRFVVSKFFTNIVTLLLLKCCFTRSVAGVNSCVEIFTFLQGYMRQALYACKTCSSKTRAAVCLACSFHCHEGHELVELYTKRHFRCDCGNSKFEGKQCNLEKVLNILYNITFYIFCTKLCCVVNNQCLLFSLQQKSAINNENKYNQNFDGVYCTCARPYPDPEGDDDEMLQCIICEDWYHSKVNSYKLL